MKQSALSQTSMAGLIYILGVFQHTLIYILPLSQCVSEFPYYPSSR